MHSPFATSVYWLHNLQCSIFSEEGFVCSGARQHRDMLYESISFRSGRDSYGASFAGEGSG